MSEPIAVVVPKELYYHEVGYVRGLEARVAKLEEALEKAQFALLYGDKEEFSEVLDAIDAALKDAPQ